MGTRPSARGAMPPDAVCAACCDAVSASPGRRGNTSRSVMETGLLLSLGQVLDSVACRLSDNYDAVSIMSRVAPDEFPCIKHRTPAAAAVTAASIATDWSLPVFMRRAHRCQMRRDCSFSRRRRGSRAARGRSTSRAPRSGAACTASRRACRRRPLPPAASPPCLRSRILPSTAKASSVSRSFEMRRIVLMST